MREGVYAGSWGRDIPFTTWHSVLDCSESGVQIKEISALTPFNFGCWRRREGDKFLPGGCLVREMGREEGRQVTRYV